MYDIVIFSVFAHYNVFVVVQHASKPQSACSGLLGGCEQYFGVRHMTVGLLTNLGAPPSANKS
jgi:hypothetical protein